MALANYSRSNTLFFRMNKRLKGGGLEMEKKSVFTLLFGFCLVLLFVVLPLMSAYSKPNPAEKMVFRYAHVVPEFHAIHKGALAMAEYVKKESKGSIEIQVFPSMQLGDTRALLEAVNIGTIEMCNASVCELALFVPQLDVYSLPFIFSNREVALGALKSKTIRAKFFPLIEAKGFIPLGFGSAEPRDISNRLRPVRTPDDLKGMRIRVMEAPIYIDAWKQLGAVPVSLPFGEVYTALQQGVVDGQENPIDISAMMKFLEVTKFVTAIGYALQTNPILFSPPLWKKLTDKQKQIMREGAAEGERVAWEVGGKSLSEGAKVAKEKYGISVVRLTPAKRKAFVKAVQPVYARCRDRIGPEYFDFFIKDVEKIAKELGY